MADYEAPVLTATKFPGRRNISLSWTFDAVANFQVFWKSDRPAGQEYALLATTNERSVATPSLQTMRTYYFYVRANIGEHYYPSNVLELIVSCGTGLIIPAEQPEELPCQLAVFGRCPMLEMSNPIVGSVYGVTQHPTDKDSFYFLEAVPVPGDPIPTFDLWKFTWPKTSTHIARLDNSRHTLYATIANPVIAYNPDSGAYHCAVVFGGYSPGINTIMMDVNLSTGVVSANSSPILGMGFPDNTNTFSHYVSGGKLHFAMGDNRDYHHTGGTPGSVYSGHIAYKVAGEGGAAVAQAASGGGSGVSITARLNDSGNMLGEVDHQWYNVSFPGLRKDPIGINPGDFRNLRKSAGCPINVVESGAWRYGFIAEIGNDKKKRFVAYNITTGAYGSVRAIEGNSAPNESTFDMHRKGGNSVIAYNVGSDTMGTVYVSKFVTSPSLVLFGTRRLDIDSIPGSTARVKNCSFNYPWIYVYHTNGEHGQCITKMCNGVF